MSEDYYKARISELERQQEEANRADYNYLNIGDEQKLWELYKDERVRMYRENSRHEFNINADALVAAKSALNFWKERK